jgi:hypothetical protein
MKPATLIEARAAILKVRDLEFAREMLERRAVPPRLLEYAGWF